jgi:hypothetical protein
MEADRIATDPLKKEAVRKADVTLEAEIGVMHIKNRGGPQAKNDRQPLETKKDKETHSSLLLPL